VFFLPLYGHFLASFIASYDIFPAQNPKVSVSAKITKEQQKGH
jgi:hypothetical protein